MSAVCEETDPQILALPRSAGWWQAWRARFGLAEVCGTTAALSGFAVGYLPDRFTMAGCCW